MLLVDTGDEPTGFLKLHIFLICLGKSFLIWEIRMSIDGEKPVCRKKTCSFIFRFINVVVQQTVLT